MAAFSTVFFINLWLVSLAGGSPHVHTHVHDVCLSICAVEADSTSTLSGEILYNVQAASFSQSAGCSRPSGPR